MIILVISSTSSEEDYFVEVEQKIYLNQVRYEKWGANINDSCC